MLHNLTALIASERLMPKGSKEAQLVLVPLNKPKPIPQPDPYASGAMFKCAESSSRRTRGAMRRESNVDSLTMQL